MYATIKKSIVYDIRVREIKIETGWGNSFLFLSVLTLWWHLLVRTCEVLFLSETVLSTLYWLVHVTDGWSFRFIHIWLCSLYIQQCFEMSHWWLPFSRPCIPACCMRWFQNCIKSDTKLHIPYPQHIYCLYVPCSKVSHMHSGLTHS